MNKLLLTLACLGAALVLPAAHAQGAAPSDAGAPAPAEYAVAMVVSADPAYDSALLGMVASLHQAS